MKRFSVILLITVFIFVLSLPSFKAHATDNTATGDTTFHILFISSYNYSYSIVPDQLEGFIDGLGTASYDIDYAFMDTKKYFSHVDLDAFYDYLSYKLNHTNPYDIVILADDNALQFWLNRGKSLIPDIDAIFFGINNLQDARRTAALPNYTGVAEISDYASTIKLIQRIFPRRHRVVALVDGSAAGNGEYSLFMETSENYPSLEYSVINSGDYSGKGLKRALSKLGPDDVILYLDFLEDAEGNIYTERSAYNLLSTYAPDIPVLRVSSDNIGQCVLGGITYSHYEAAKWAGQTAIRVLNGTDISTIPLCEDIFTYTVFDQDLMDKYSVRKSDLPADAVVINEHWSLAKFYKENFIMSNLILLIILMLFFLVIILFYVSRRRDQLVKQDYLTGMPNRLYINARLKEAAEKRDPYGIIMMDVDFFKHYNDSLGHPVGDELLKSVAERLLTMATDELIFARIGGDEFMGLILGQKVDHASEVCNDISTTMKKAHDTSAGPLNITVSIGCARFPHNTDDPEALMNLADAALYEVKERGRDGYMLYDPSVAAHE